MATPVIMPKSGMSMETGTVLRWLKRPGDAVRRGEPLLEIETDKLAMEVEAETEGVLLAITRGPGETVAVTETIGYIGTAGESLSDSRTPARDSSRPATEPVAPSRAAALNTPPPAPGSVRASPLARAVAAQRGLDLTRLRGTGPGGAVRLRDLPAPGGPAQGQGPSRVSLTGARRAIAARMSLSRREIPAATLHMDADVTLLEGVRVRWNADHEKPLSLTVFALRAAALACREHPLLRTTLEGDDLVTRHEVCLGLAVSRTSGLVVPVIRAADTLDLSALAHQTAELAYRARENKLTPDDVRGAVFTLSNLGMYGVTSFDPIIDPPQSAILAVGAVRDHLTLLGDRVVVCRRMDLGLSFDHRVMDGAEAAVALRTLRSLLESPLALTGPGLPV